MLNTLIRMQQQIEELRTLIDDLKTSERPIVGCEVYNSADIAHTSSGSWQSVTFNSELYDPYGMHSTVTNTSRVNGVFPGWYLANGVLAFAANATGMRAIAVYVNGSILYAVQGMNAQSSGSTWLAISCIARLSAGDYLELRGYQSSGGSLNMLALSRYSLYLRVARLS